MVCDMYDNVTMGIHSSSYRFFIYNITLLYVLHSLDRALSESLDLPKTRTEQHVVLAIKGVCRHDQKSSNGATQQ